MCQCKIGRGKVRREDMCVVRGIMWLPTYLPYHNGLSCKILIIV